MKNVLFLSLTILGYAAGTAIASVYHVAQKNPAADDKNPGTADKPFQTIEAAVAGARLKPGDTLYVHEGVYPIKDIEWILDDDSATVLIFGVTAE